MTWRARRKWRYFADVSDFRGAAWNSAVWVLRPVSLKIRVTQITFPATWTARGGFHKRTALTFTGGWSSWLCLVSKNRHGGSERKGRGTRALFHLSRLSRDELTRKFAAFLSRRVTRVTRGFFELSFPLLFSFSRCLLGSVLFSLFYGILAPSFSSSLYFARLASANTRRQTGVNTSGKKERWKSFNGASTDNVDASRIKGRVFGLLFFSRISVLFSLRFFLFFLFCLFV